MSSRHMKEGLGQKKEFFAPQYRKQVERIWAFLVTSIDYLVRK